VCVIRQVLKKTINILLIAEDVVKLEYALVPTAPETRFSARCCRVFGARIYLVPCSSSIPCFTSVLLPCVIDIKNDVQNLRDGVEANSPVMYPISITDTELF
jgi:hypothetical protein